MHCMGTIDHNMEHRTSDATTRSGAHNQKMENSYTEMQNRKRLSLPQRRSGCVCVIAT